MVKLNLHLLYFGPRNASYTNSTSIFLLFITIVLSWPEDGRSRPKHVAKYNLIVIIASCLDVCCVLTVHNILYGFDNTQRYGLSEVYRNSLRSLQ